MALRWLVQHGAATCPGADTLEYMRQDADLFDWELARARPHPVKSFRPGNPSVITALIEPGVITRLLT